MNYRPTLCPRCHKALEHTVVDELHYCPNCHEMWSDEEIFWFRVDQDIDKEIDTTEGVDTVE